MRHSGDSDRMFLHGFQQSGLRLRSRAVDFVGEQHVCEQRPLLKLKNLSTITAFCNDLSPHEVGRHQVGRELDAVEIEMQSVRQCPDGQRFPEAWHTFQQHVATGNQ